METISTTNYNIYFNETCYPALNTHIKENNYSKVFILVDSNTNMHCLPILNGYLETHQDIEIIEIEPNEINKTIDTCVGVWNVLSELDADRKCLIINLGGGVVTDLGGFVASTYKRGVNFINIPTTLLAMVDASVGGKTGVDLGHLKNQIGVINTPQMVLIDSIFIDTLPAEEIRSGYAEMLKHGLIKDRNYWNALNDFSKVTLNDLDAIIYTSVVIKNAIVEEDPFENGVRKTLNFGHTLGHAIESFYLNSPDKKTLLHGEAIAIGMVLAAFLSYKVVGFPESDLNSVKTTMAAIHKNCKIEEKDYNSIIELLKYDKKNSHGNINFVLLESVEKPLINKVIDKNLITEAFDFYNH